MKNMNVSNRRINVMAKKNCSHSLLHTDIHGKGPKKSLAESLPNIADFTQQTLTTEMEEKTKEEFMIQRL